MNVKTETDLCRWKAGKRRFVVSVMWTPFQKDSWDNWDTQLVISRVRRAFHQAPGMLLTAWLQMKKGV